MAQQQLELNLELKPEFHLLKPICNDLMMKPTPENVRRFLSAVRKASKSIVQEMHLYIMYPLIHHLRSSDFSGKHEMQHILVEALQGIVRLVDVDTMNIFTKYFDSLIIVIFDRKQPDMVRPLPEELKLSIMEALTVLMFRLDNGTLIRVYTEGKNRTTMATCIYVALQMAKAEKLRSLKMAAINLVLAITATHDKFLSERYLPIYKPLRVLAADMVAVVLPGVISGLQEVATSSENQGHAITVKALNALHRIMCLVLNDEAAQRARVSSLRITSDDFVKLVKNHKGAASKEIPNKKPAINTPEWFDYTADKLKDIIRSLLVLKNHDHDKVKWELAVFCSRLLIECANTMAPSIPIVLDILITYSEDECSTLSAFCRETLVNHFNENDEHGNTSYEALRQHFYVLLASLPRIVNNIDTHRKLLALNQLQGFLVLLTREERPQMLTWVLQCGNGLELLCDALVECCAIENSFNLMCLSTRDIDGPVQTATPWCLLGHLEDRTCVERMKNICRLLGAADCTDMIVDKLLEMFNDGVHRPEVAYVLNYIMSARMVQILRILETYLEPETWYLPLEVSNPDLPLTSEDTLDYEVYNPRSWDKETVPGLYEGTIETRYTDIQLRHPAGPPPVCDASQCRTLQTAQNNMLLSCLITEGIGVAARAMKDDFQPYMLKTLCLLLERAGSKYEMLHLAGMKALWDVSVSCGHTDVAQLIRNNSDYFAYQLTMRLKRPWKSVSALQILTVVMRHSDASILTFLHGFIADALMQSCDSYHEQDVTAYLQVFLTFVSCIRKWFPKEHSDTATNEIKTDATKSEEINNDQIQSNVTKSDEIQSDEIQSNITKSDEIQSNVTKSDKIQSVATKSDEMQSDATKSEEQSNVTKSDKIQSVATKSDEMQSDATKSEEQSNVTKSDKIQSIATKSDEIQSVATKSDEMQSDATKSEEQSNVSIRDELKSDVSKSEEIESGETKIDELQNNAKESEQIQSDVTKSDETLSNIKESDVTESEEKQSDETKGEIDKSLSDEKKIAEALRTINKLMQMRIPKDNILSDTLDYIKNTEIPEQLLSKEDFESESGQTVEEMFQEDLKKKEEEEENYGVDYNNENEEKPPPPEYITMTITILKRCIHFVPSHKREEKILALQILCHGLRILADYEDELLPLVHQVWGPLVERFYEVDQLVVLRRAFLLLVVMAEVSKDFIRNRTVKEVLPRLCTFLHDYSAQSLRMDSGSAYRLSQAYRLQLAVLDHLGALILHLGLRDDPLADVLACTGLYLSNEQPKPLQAAAVDIFRKTLTYDHGATLCCLRILCGNRNIIPQPRPSLLLKTPYRIARVRGSARHPSDKKYKNNLVAVFRVVKMLNEG